MNLKLIYIIYANPETFSGFFSLENNLPRFLSPSLIPRPLPDFVSQLWIFLHGCKIKSGSGLGKRLPFTLMTTGAFSQNVSKITFLFVYANQIMTEANLCS